MIDRLVSAVNEQCVICLKEGAPTHPVGVAGADLGEQDCPRCGRFRISGTALAMARQIRHMRARSRLSRHVRRNNDEFGAIPSITSEDVQAVIGVRDASVEERAQGLFAYLVAYSPRLGTQLAVTDPALDGAAGSQIDDDNPGEFCAEETLWLLRMLQTRGWIEERDGDYEVTPAGYARWEETVKARSQSRLAFVAMPFNQPMSDAIRQGTMRGITAARYEPFVVNDAEHIGRIDDLIVSTLRTARLLVCDLTYHRPNVYWEAGFCFGLGIPVFLTCQAEAVREMHFDIRQYNAIAWVSADELAAKLERRIEAVLGAGPVG